MPFTKVATLASAAASLPGSVPYLIAQHQRQLPSINRLVQHAGGNAVKLALALGSGVAGHDDGGQSGAACPQSLDDLQTRLIAQSEIDDQNISLKTIRQSFFGLAPTCNALGRPANLAQVGAKRHQDLRLGRLFFNSNQSHLWLLDVSRNELLVHREPVDGLYRLMRRLSAHDVACPEAAPEISVRLSELAG